MLFIFCLSRIYHSKYKEYVQKDGDKPWNWPKICKLCVEDSMSLVLNTGAIAFIYNAHIGVFSGISLLVSLLTFMFMCGKQAVYNPCKNGNHCCDKCGGCMCCILWMIVSALILFFLVIGSFNFTYAEMRVIVIDDECVIYYPYAQTEKTKNGEFEYVCTEIDGMECAYLVSDENQALCWLVRIRISLWECYYCPRWIMHSKSISHHML